jgi:hypothetical protein
MSTGITKTKQNKTKQNKTQKTNKHNTHTHTHTHTHTPKNIFIQQYGSVSRINPFYLISALLPQLPHPLPHPPTPTSFPGIPLY